MVFSQHNQKIFYHHPFRMTKMESHSQELEKGDATALAFRNDKVATLSWQDLSVTVLDRASKQEKHILHKASGILHAGMFPVFDQLRPSSVV